MVTITDEFFVFSDAELLERIRELSDALASPDQSGSSREMGSFSNKSPSEMRAERDRMTRAYALRTGQAVPARQKPRIHRVFVRKDYF